MSGKASEPSNSFMGSNEELPDTSPGVGLEQTGGRIANNPMVWLYRKSTVNVSDA
jgi:hypothetical protein